jgi:hypothetical protein
LSFEQYVSFGCPIKNSAAFSLLIGGLKDFTDSDYRSPPKLGFFVFCSTPSVDLAGFGQLCAAEFEVLALADG